jgi:hypothetical protein
VKSSELTNEISAAHAMPLEIIKAIISIMGKVKKLAKEGTNTYQRYRFTSVDQFYEAVGQLISEHGLCNFIFERSHVIEVRETTNDKGETKRGVWMTGEYDIVLYHESGAMSEPITRTITVQASGPQSYASAQSYVEKYFWRNLLKIPTGDKDEVEEAAPDGLPQSRPIQFITPEQVEDLDTLLVELGDEVTAGFKKYFKIEFLGRLPATDFSTAVKMLAKKKEKKDAAEKAQMTPEFAEPAQ